MILDTQTMNKDYIIEMIKMDCPICGKTHEVEKRQTIAQTIIKGEAIEHDEVYFLCPLSHGDEDTFVPAAVMDNNLLIARNAYRKKHGLLTSTAQFKRTDKMKGHSNETQYSI